MVLVACAGTKLFWNWRTFGYAAERIAGLRIDRDAHQIITGAVDQIAVGIDLKIAGACIVGDAVEDRLVVHGAGGHLHREEAVAVDRHVGRNGRRGDGARRGQRLLGKRLDAAGDLRGRRRRLGNEILEAGIDALVADGRGIRDVAGDVLQRVGLRLQAAHRGIERIEDTHNIVSTFDSSGRPALPGRGRRRRRHRKRCAKNKSRAISAA